MAIAVLAVITFTLLSTLNPCLKTLTVLLYTMGHFAVAAFGVLGFIVDLRDFLNERHRIPFLDLSNFDVSFFGMVVVVMAVRAITIFLALSSYSEAFAVKF